MSIRIGRSGSAASAGYSPIGAAFDALYYRSLYADEGYPKSFSDMHTLTRASTKYAQNLAGVWTEFASGVAAITDRGILIEESRTNSIRNSSTQGAGSGVQPTNWVSSATANNVTRTIGSPGVSAQGIEFMSYQYAGTPSASSTYGVGGESVTQIAASSGQTWTASFFVRLAAGSDANATFNVIIRERDAGGASLALTTGPAFVPTSSWQRVSVTRTFTEATTAFVSASVGASYTNGLAIDSTLEIGWPQLELGAFATSPIRTTNAAATRAADVITIDPKYSSLAQGSAYFEWDEIVGPVGSEARAFALRVDANERMQLAITNPSSLVIFTTVSGGVASASPVSASAVVLANTYKAAIRWGTNDVAMDLTASLGDPAPDVSCVMPVGAHNISIGNSGSPGSFFNRYIRRLTFYPRKLTDAELGALVA